MIDQLELLVAYLNTGRRRLNLMARETGVSRKTIDLIAKNGRDARYGTVSKLLTWIQARDAEGFEIALKVVIDRRGSR